MLTHNPVKTLNLKQNSLPNLTPIMKLSDKLWATTPKLPQTQLSPFGRGESLIFAPSIEPKTNMPSMAHHIIEITMN